MYFISEASSQYKVFAEVCALASSQHLLIRFPCRSMCFYQEASLRYEVIVEVCTSMKKRHRNITYLCKELRNHDNIDLDLDLAL